MARAGVNTGPAAAAGAAMPAAFAPHELYWVAPLLLAALFALWQGVSPRRAAWRGFLFGAGMFGVGVTWIYISIHQYGDVGVGLTLFITVLFVTVLSLFPALAGGLARRLALGRPAAAPLLIFPAAWLVAEWVRGWFLTGFPWLNLGYSQIDAPLRGWGPVAGVYGISLAVALTAGALLFLARRPAPRAAAAAAAMMALLWLAGWGLSGVHWTRPTGHALRVSLVQGNIPQDVKWLPQMRDPTVDLYERLTARHWDSDLVIWPETAIPAFYPQVEDRLDEFAAGARRHHTDVLLGIIGLAPDMQRYYNAVLQLGDRTGFYYKHHLVPFTEYLPMQGALGGLIKFMDVPMSSFTAGPARQPPMPVKGQKVAVSICYEDAFGEELVHALPAATVLANVSDDAWFGHSAAAAQHLQIARMRALEAGRPLLRATNTGISAFIGPDGVIEHEAPPYEETVLTASVQPMAGLTPYARWGNLPVLALTALLLLGALVLRRPYRQ